MLYICPTPIGNLDDITIRTLDTLKSVDEIYSEDTRHTLNLLNHFDIKKPLFSLFEHNEIEKSEEVVEKLFSGKNIAYVSDAGMPGISDPGEILIKNVIKNDLDFTVLPGPSALIVAVVASGLSTKNFTFLGFLDRNKSKMKMKLEKVKEREDTLIIYESPHRIEKTLETILDVLGNRKITLAREISKKFEEYVRDDIKSLIEKFSNEKIMKKGEMIVIIEGASLEKEEVSDDYIINELKKYIDDGFSKKDSVKKVSEKLNIKKNYVYSLSRQI